MAETKERIEKLFCEYYSLVYRVAFSQIKNHADAEDITQEVFLKLLHNDMKFENIEHEKAWIIRVAVNSCKDLLKSFFRSRTVSIEDIVLLPAVQAEEYNNVLETVLGLPQKYKDVVYLHYYEGYSAVDIGKILGKNVNTVYTLLARARKMLQERLGEYE